MYSEVVYLIIEGSVEGKTKNRSGSGRHVPSMVTFKDYQRVGAQATYARTVKNSLYRFCGLIIIQGVEKIVLFYYSGYLPRETTMIFHHKIDF